MKHIENSLHNVLYWWRCEQVGFSQLFFASIDLQHARQSAVLLYPPLKEDSLLDLLSVLAHFDIFF